MRERAIARDLVIILAAAGAAVVAFAGPPVPQPTSYHTMADQRTWLGIPNALNVLSNLPFAIVGLLGLQAIFTSDVQRRVAFQDSWERWPAAALFTGVALTTFGSSYYHLAPDNQRLVWDRLPMTVGFMGLLTVVLADRGHPAVARRLFVPLLVAGAVSVAYWYWTEVRGAGDLRPYLLVQFGSLLVVLLLLALYPSRSGGSGYLLAALVGYGVAKAFEVADVPIFALGGFVSGHTLKHLAAAASVWCLVGMLRSRRVQSIGVTAAVVRPEPTTVIVGGRQQ
jgi:hypothetical protein